jgi:hypothetical protein
MRADYLQKIGDALNRVGWFVPPYVSVGMLGTVAQEITQAQGNSRKTRWNKYRAFSIARIGLLRWSYADIRRRRL